MDGLQIAADARPHFDALGRFQSPRVLVPFDDLTLDRRAYGDFWRRRGDGLGAPASVDDENDSQDNPR